MSEEFIASRKHRRAGSFAEAMWPGIKSWVKEEDPEFFEGGQKYDQGKLMYDLIPMECMDELAKILTYGAEKYGKPSGWETVPDMENRYYAALMRHLSKSRQGEKLDPESGYSHLSHALCNVVFLLWKELQNGTQRMDTSV